MSALGHERPICDVRAMSAYPSTPDIMLSAAKRRSGPLADISQALFDHLVGCCFCRRRGESTNYGRSMPDQVGRQRRKPVVVVLGPARLNRHVAAFAVAGLAEALTKGGKHLRPIPVGRSGREHTNYRYSALLGPCCTRPSSRTCGGRTAKQGDEITSSHCLPQSLRTAPTLVDYSRDQTPEERGSDIICTAAILSR
jgi:hypothetical protein